MKAYKLFTTYGDFVGVIYSHYTPPQFRNLMANVVVEEIVTAPTVDVPCDRCGQPVLHRNGHPIQYHDCEKSNETENCT